MQENERRKLIGVIHTGGDDFIDLSTVDLSNPEALLKHKPRTWPGDDDSWVMHAAVIGIEHAWNHDFQEFMKNGFASGRFPKIKPKDVAPGMFWEVYFGKTGMNGFKITGGDWEEMTAYFMETDLKIADLGAFSEWLKESGINKYAKAIIKEFLED